MTLFAAVGCIVVLMLASIGLGGGIAAATCATPVSGTIPNDGSVATVSGKKLDADQWHNARVIVATGVKMNIPVNGLVIAIATAYAESTLTVLDHGDTAGPDSRGLFQQRDPWGPLKVRMDPAGSSRLFFNALKSTKGWKKMSLADAAHAVQSFDPTLKYRYAELEPFATATVARALSTPSEPVPDDGPAPAKPGKKAPKKKVVQTSTRESAEPFTRALGPDPAVSEKRVWPLPKSTSQRNFGAKGNLWSLGYHTGLDFSAPTGTKIHAAHSGQVLEAGVDGSWGTYLLVGWKDASGRSWTNRYAHLSKRFANEVGQNITAGVVIGEVGATGNVTGPHLHFELTPDGSDYSKSIDPMPWLETGALEAAEDASQADCTPAGGVGVPGAPGEVIGVHPTLGNVASPLSKPFRDGGHAYYIGDKAGELHSVTYDGKGMDLFGKIGDPIHAFADGVASVPAYQSGYGHRVEIRHRDNTVSIYAHLTEVLIKPGPVSAGQKIATMGCSGTSGESNNCRNSEQHLHFEWSGLRWKPGEYGELPPFWAKWPQQKR